MSACAVPTCPEPVRGSLASFCDGHWALVPGDYRRLEAPFTCTDEQRPVANQLRAYIGLRLNLAAVGR